MGEYFAYPAPTPELLIDGENVLSLCYVVDTDSRILSADPVSGLAGLGNAAAGGLTEPRC